MSSAIDNFSREILACFRAADLRGRLHRRHPPRWRHPARLGHRHVRPLKRSCAEHPAATVPTGLALPTGTPPRWWNAPAASRCWRGGGVVRWHRGPRGLSPPLPQRRPPTKLPLVAIPLTVIGEVSDMRVTRRGFAGRFSGLDGLATVRSAPIRRVTSARLKLKAWHRTAPCRGVM